MIENLMWIVTGVSIVGTVLNIKKMQVCFYIWFCTNSVWCIYDFLIGSYAQSALFLVYVGLAVWGIISWKK